MMSSMDVSAEHFLSFGASDSFCVGEFDFDLKRDAGDEIQSQRKMMQIKKME